MGDLGSSFFGPFLDHLSIWVPDSSGHEGTRAATRSIEEFHRALGTEGALTGDLSGGKSMGPGRLHVGEPVNILGTSGNMTFSTMCEGPSDKSRWFQLSNLVRASQVEVWRETKIATVHCIPTLSIQGELLQISVIGQTDIEWEEAETVITSILRLVVWGARQPPACNFSAAREW